MSTINKYVPVLKLKQGEIKAITSLPKELSSSYIPLFEIPPIEYDYENKQNKLSLAKHLSKTINNIKKIAFLPCIYLDFKYVDILKNATLFEDISLYFAEELPLVSTIPVVSNSSSDKYINCINSMIDKLPFGICFRIYMGVNESVVASINRLSSVFPALQKSNIDLFLDRGSLEHISPNDLQTLTDNELKNLSAGKLINPWRNVILSASSFPLNLVGIDGDTILRIPRTEWINWRRVIKTPEFSKIVYSDYPISHPETQEVDFRLMQRSASIRYSTKDNWVILKGRSVKTHPESKQYREKSKELIQLNDYLGASFSEGDKFIFDCANSPAGTGCGNATSWRFVGVNHHISLILKLI